MKDSWKSSDPYEYFMGRWSSLVAESFLDWLSPSPGLNWLDVGCGSGALSKIIINKYKPAKLTAIDQSEDFVTAAKKRLGSRGIFRVGDAMNLPLDTSSVNFTVSGLVLNFISEKDKALSEMMRVTSKGDVVAVYVWDYAGKMDFLKMFWDTVVELNPEAAHLHEGSRFQDSRESAIKGLFEGVGFREIKTAPIEINTNFQNFDDYWKPFLGGQGPAPTYVASLNESDRINLRDVLYKKLTVRPDGSIRLVARAWAAKGTV